MSQCRTVGGGSEQIGIVQTGDWCDVQRRRREEQRAAKKEQRNRSAPFLSVPIGRRPRQPAVVSLVLLIRFVDAPRTRTRARTRTIDARFATADGRFVFNIIGRVVGRRVHVDP